MLKRTVRAAGKTMSVMLSTVLLLSGFAFAPPPAMAADYDPTYAISDDNMRHASSMSAAQVQAFLNTKAGPLDTLRTKDHLGVTRSAAEIIVQAAKAWNINPKVIIVTLQKEQSLIDAAVTPRTLKYRLDTAMGAGAYGGTNRYPGFGNQIWNGARLLDSYGEPYGTIVSQFVKGKTKIAGVYPKNIATYKLYVYTPYVSGPRTTNTLYRKYFGSPFTAPRFVGVYRFRNRSNGTYLYTGSIAERHKLRTSAYSTRWAYEGLTFSWDTSVSASATVPMYRYKNRYTKKIEYSTSKSLYTYRTSAAGKRTWITYSPAFRVSLRRTTGSVPVYRFKNRYTGATFLTTSVSTVRQLRSTRKSRAKWRYYGAWFYLPRYKAPVTPPPSTPTTETPSGDASDTVSGEPAAAQTPMPSAMIAMPSTDASAADEMTAAIQP